MEKTGTVIAHKDNQNKIVIRLDNAEGEACKSCASHSICKTTSEKILELSTGTLVKDGEKVNIALSEGRSIFLSFLLFIFPLIVLIVVYMLFAALKWNEVGAMFAAMAVSVLTFLGVLKTEDFLLKKTSVQVMNDEVEGKIRTETQK